MAETLVTRIRNRVGTYTNATQLTEWLATGVRIVYHNMPKSAKDMFATSTLVSGGLATTNKVICSFRYNGPGRYITADKKYWVSNDTIHKGSTFSPVGWFENETFYTYPDKCYALVLTVATIASSATSITDFPYEYEEAPILYACVQATQAKIQALLDTIAALSWEDKEAPVSPAPPNFIYNNATLGMFITEDIAFTGSISYNPVVTDITFTNMETALSDEDEVLASAEGQKLQIKLEQIQKDLLNNLNEFNQEVENTKNDLQVAIQNANMATEALLAEAKAQTDVNLANEAQQLAARVQEYQAELKRYDAEVGIYTALIQEEVSRISSGLQKNTVILDGYLKNLVNLKTEYKELLMQIATEEIDYGR